MTEMKGWCFLNLVKTKKNKIFLPVFLCVFCLSACAFPYKEESGAGQGSRPLQEIATPVTLGEESALLHKKDQSGRYCYESLTAEEQMWYEDMYAIMEGMYTDVILSPLTDAAIDEQNIDKIFQCVMNDHPEMFYVKGYTYTLYTYGGETEKISFSGTYTMDAAARKECKQLIDSAVDECLSHISMDASDYEKVKYVYQYLVLNTEYDQQAPENQNICSVFIDRRSVCQGYAKAAQYLLEKLAVPSTLVIGSVYNGESHAWNLVQIDGSFYYVDATWGDASYQVVESEGSLSVDSLPAINYDYLCVTTEQLLKTHVIDNVVPLPECTSLDANYYIMEGAYFTAYDTAQVAAFFEKGYETGRQDITLKCSDKAVYDEFYEQLITGQKIFDYLNSTDGVIAYAEDADNHSMTFWLVNE